MNKEKISLASSEKCCSCSACFSVCPKQAISMQENDEGFLQPVIDEKKCIHCGKCQTVCPVLKPVYKNNPKPTSYATMASDEIRMKSSSGGVFTLLAEYVLDKGGYVCGAAYDKDWTVHHIIINKKEDLDKVRKSKYMQSRIENCYIEIKKLLDEDKYVLFGGTPCQVAGLNKYLNKEYEKLITIDVVCHGVPSPKVFKKFLKENNPDVKIKEVDFREKEVKGWVSHTVIRYENGEVYRKAHDECPYFRGFLGNFFENKSCADCLFNKFPRQGDFTLGDFWRIREYNKNFTDKKGTGVVLLNTSKAENIFQEIKTSLKLCKTVPMDFTLKSNPNINCSFKHNKNRDKFFEYLQKYSYVEAFKRAKNEKFDACVVGLGWFPNYGAALTSFGLIKTLEDLGLSVCMLDRPVEASNRPVEKDRSRTFSQKYFHMTEQYSKLSVHELNKKVDTFIVGSDQLWHWNTLQRFSEYWLLSFVHANRRKIAYASSFGHDTFTAPTLFKYIYSYLFSRFDAISVREISGVKILKDMGIKGTHVLDPVFLCDSKHFENLAKSVEPREKGKYIFTYILDPHIAGNKKDLLVNISKKYQIPLCNVVDMHDEDKHAKDLGLPTARNLSVEEFISNLYHSEYVITDSFHGVCFSIIFRKKFICIGNALRGIARFESLLTKLGLTNRMLYHCDEFEKKEDLLTQEIDYDSVFKKMEQEKEISFKFLKDALNAPIKTQDPTDAFDALNVKMWQNLVEMWNRDKTLRERMDYKFGLKRIPFFLKYRRYYLLSKITWGEKRKHYKRKYKELKQKLKDLK